MFINLMRWLYDDIVTGYTAGFANDVKEVLGRPPRKFSDYLKEYAKYWKNQAEQ
jgi:hypothetical protein